MNNKLNFRKLVEGDYETICKWWKWWRWPIPPKDFLPNDGKSGFIVEKNNIPIVSGFLFITNSKGAKLEWIVSNPKYREDDRKDAIELLIVEAEKMSKDLGFEHMFSIGRNKQLMETHKKLGWHVDKKPSHELVKILNT